ncbi:MAG: flagellar basal body-associated protein FliL [Epsilonproteobacteria bacterium]|nr:flagellar basal body-associated protein FliL [Campylobacterota bacterium]
MAEEKKEEEVAPKKSSSKLVLIIIVVLLLLILIGGGVAAYFLLGDSGDEQAGDAPNQTQAQSKQMKKKSIARNSDLMQIGPIYPLDQFIVNLLSENGSRFLKIKMDLELSAPELTAELDKKKPLIRDIVIRTLTSKTFQEVSTGKGKEKLKDELVDRINSVLADGNIKNIFFTEFVVQ